MKKQYRVKKSSEIESILKNRKYSSNSYFTIYKKNNKETSHFRYAMSVNKKIGHAVVRNRLKRQVRAIIREFNIIDNVDIFIIVRNKILNLSFQEMKKQLEDLFKKQKLIKKGENDDSIYK